ncbi:hypothetical protein [Streptomyces anulatus]|uniref:hypothetical protein n=1 Tax=Streptomyces anulatus TaxID=1892 RepID=UPI003442F3A2
MIYISLKPDFAAQSFGAAMETQTKDGKRMHTFPLYIKARNATSLPFIYLSLIDEFKVNNLPSYAFRPCFCVCEVTIG